MDIEEYAAMQLCSDYNKTSFGFMYFISFVCFPSRAAYGFWVMVVYIKLRGNHHLNMSFIAAQLLRPSREEGPACERQGGELKAFPESR